MSLLFALFALTAVPCLCHKRLVWPTPRSTSSGPNTSPPCGGISFGRAYAQNLITDLDAGSEIEIIILDAIFHAEQPMRLAISGENNEDFDCIWLNHIPQHTRGAGPRNLTIPITVPDFTCKNCTLQMMAFETQALTDDSCCAYTNNDTKTCEVQQYYSCANININGGRRKRSDVCVQPEGWAFRSYTCNYYRAEKSTDAWVLQGDGNTLQLKTSGDISGLPDQDTFCSGSNLPIAANSDCHKTATDFTQLSLLQGGDMSSGGIFAIVLVIILGIVIAATLIITKMKGIKPVNEREADTF